MGPILCLIYVNDLPRLPTETSADIFADDTTISAVNRSKEDLVQSLTNYLQNVLYWCNSNNMSVISKHYPKNFLQNSPERVIYKKKKH